MDENEITGNTSFQEMKSMAVQVQMQSEEINGRKQGKCNNFAIFSSLIYSLLICFKWFL